MYAISFDLEISELEKYYGKPYNNAYFEVSKILYKNGFYRIQGSTYVTESKDMSKLVFAITELSNIEWFANSVKDIRAFRIEDWSNFTEFVKLKATNK